MSRKVYIEAKVKFVLFVEEGQSMDDVMDEIEITHDAIDDSEILSYEIKDVK